MSDHRVLDLFPPGSVVDPDGVLTVGGCRLDAVAAEFGTPVIPPRLDVLWVITCDGTTGSLPPGSKVVQMKHKG